MMSGLIILRNAWEKHHNGLHVSYLSDKGIRFVNKKKIVLSFVFQHSQNHVASKQNDFKTFERMNIGKHGSEL